MQEQEQKHYTILHLSECNETDKVDENKDFYYYLTPDKDNDNVTYTNDPIHDILSIQPNEIHWYPYNIKGEIVSLYVNSLLYSGYTIHYKRSKDIDYDKNGKEVGYYISPTLYFIKKDILVMNQNP